MSNLIRLDKYLADMSVGTRSQVKKVISQGRVKVNDVVTKDSSQKINTECDTVVFDSKRVKYHVYEYYMLNKPAGIITATTDKKEKTVIDLIETKSRKDLFPVGRLDRDTEGLLLITNDGELGHRLLSPKYHVDKTYYVETDTSINDESAKLLRNGIEIEDGVITRPADLEILSINDKNAYYLTIREGKFHQVKRMFQKAGANVTYLKRLSMGPLVLDENLMQGLYRKLTDEEIEKLYIDRME